MKNKGNLIISIIAVLISLVALVIGIVAFWSSCKMEYDSGNAIMSAFSIIVTILIGTVTVLIVWQVYNHRINGTGTSIRFDDFQQEVLGIWESSQGESQGQPPVPYEGTENAQYHKPRIRYNTMHIDEKTIKQAL